MHFGSRHWTGNNEQLLAKINTYKTDLVINTGDNTTDALESEYQAASSFLKSINCKQIVSIAGNHDKRNMLSQDFFRKYIADVKVVYPLDQQRCKKNKLFFDQHISGIKEKFTDVNFIRKLEIADVSLLVVCLDTCELYEDNGFIDTEMLRSVSHEIKQQSYDKIILLNHHSILDTDSDPLFNSNLIIEFVRKHNIKHVFCGHTHQLKLEKSTDLYHDHNFVQFKNGSLTAANTPNDSNMFLYIENFAEPEMNVHIVRIFDKGERLIFKEEILSCESW